MSEPGTLYIGQLAAEMGINPKTIRYYEDIGLLPAPQRTSTGYRLYSNADRERLGFIGKAKAIGFSLEEIAEILGLRREGQPPCEHVLTLLDNKLSAVDEQLCRLTEFRDEMLALREEAASTMTSTACVCGIIEHHSPTG